MWPFSKSKKDDVELPLTKRERENIEQARHQQKAAQALGRHYCDWVEPIKELKRQGQLDEAERILLACVDAVERESDITSYGAAPWYYEQLAIIYRQQDRLTDEVTILERCMNQRHAKGASGEKMTVRLVKARDLLAKQK